MANSKQIASFARDELGMSYTDSLNLVIILNGVGLPARVLPGYLADNHLGVLNTFILCLFANLVMLWCWLAIDSIPAYYAFTVLYGIFAAAYQSLFPTTIAAYSHEITKTGTRLGMGFAAIGMSALAGGPLSGALLQAGGSYVAPICWASASSIVGTGLAITARVLKHGWSIKKRC